MRDLRKNTAILLIVGIIMSLMNVMIPVFVVHANETATATDAMGDYVELFEGEGYTVEFRLDNQWDDGFNASITISNLTDTQIENWSVIIPFDNSFDNIWNANISKETENYYLIKNAGWNQDIPAKSSVSFGITSYERFKGFPDFCTLVGGKVQTSLSDYSVDYIVKDIWDDGLIGEIMITNLRESPIEDWRLMVSTDLVIDDIWNANIEEDGDNTYVLSCVDYNQNIPENSSVTIGFKSVGIDFSLDGFELYEYSEGDLLDDILDNESHVKEFTEDDIVYSDESGLIYIKNQIIVSGVIGVDKEVFEELAEFLDADIVGYIEYSNDYQFEFRDEFSEEELLNLVSYVETFDFVNGASLNIVNIYESQAITNDACYNDGSDDDWNEINPKGDNWGLEALRVLSAWDYASEFSDVTVGVFDTGFAVHEDLAYKKIKFNKGGTEHGTHVTGIIAAKHNNGRGISGVCINPTLYASSSGYVESSMQSREIYSYFMQNGVKVINVSMTYSSDMIFAASRGVDKAVNYITASADTMDEYFSKMIANGNDFVIVTSAGNTENDKFVYDENTDNSYNYRNSVESDDEENIDSGNVDARYASEITAIKSESVKNRIIVVGSIGYKNNNGKTSYYYSDFSNIGSRVDVCAPGERILSTVPKSSDASGYSKMGGTSMASPYIAGIAGLIYQINPDLSGSAVKSLIKNNIRIHITDKNGINHGLPDACACVLAAREKKNDSSSEEQSSNISSGTYIKGFVEDIYGNAIYKTSVSANKTNFGNGNLGIYRYSTITNIIGLYSINVSDGQFAINYLADGYMPLSVKNINVYPNQTTYVDVVKLQKWSNGYFTSNLSGNIKDALTGKKVSAATIKLRKGWNNTEGKYVVGRNGSELICKTGSNGEFSFVLPGGGYTLEVVKEGYITEYYNAIASPDEYSENQSVIITPILPDNEMRIVLTWDENPRDLDSHLTFYRDDEQEFHVYYGYKKAYIDQEIVAELDLDDTSSYGPETVTITLDTDLLEDGRFSYSVHDFTNRKSSNSEYLSNSNATIKVYKGSEYLNTFRVQKENVGTVWHVFDYDKEGLSLVDEFYNESTPKEVE